MKLTSHAKTFAYYASIKPDAFHATYYTQNHAGILGTSLTTKMMIQLKIEEGLVEFALATHDGIFSM